MAISAAIFLFLMLLRILNEQENIFKEIRKGTRDLMDTGEKLHSMYSLAENLIEKIKQARPPISSQPFSEVDLISQDLVTKNIKKIEGIASEIRVLISKLSSIPASDAPSRPNDSSLAISQLIADQKSLNPEIPKLQKGLDQILADLKRTNLLAFNNVSSNKELEDKLENYQRMVIKAREKSRVSENTIAELESEISLLKSKNSNTNVEPNDTIEQLKSELKKVNLEKSTLIQKVESLSSEINRTKIEKDFIEDKFIEIS